MRRIIALLVAASLGAGCARATVATGAVISTIGLVGVGLGAANQGNSSCDGNPHGCIDLGFDSSVSGPSVTFLVLGAAMVLGGMVAVAVEEARRREPEATLPPPAPAPPRYGQWREVPPVDESAEP